MNLRFLFARKRLPHRFPFLLAAALALILSAGCLSPRLPIQCARTTQEECYRQVFIFQDAGHFRDVFGRWLGEKNARVLLEHYAIGDAIDDLLHQRVEARGSLEVTFYPVPGDPASFFLEGSGRYFLVRATTNEIMLVGDFTIRSERQSLPGGGQGEIRLVTRHTQIRQFAPQELNYVNDVPMEVLLRIQVLPPENKVFRIDYDARHDVLLDDRLIGYLEFDKTAAQKDKIIDLRVLDRVYDDYGTQSKPEGNGEP